ncbi:MAG: hypothetical protein HQK54_02300, partial [Oligoflexales bacterium]|nr:hypothetical protein [Oligoflexales bacterium]
MKASLQQQISPYIQPDNPGLNTKNSFDTPEQDEQINPNRIDFKKILSNAQEDLKMKREAQKKGDLSGAKSEKEFFDMLNNNTKEKRTPKSDLDKDDFLKLFIAQLQHQDPLNPDDGAEMAAKLAQFNSLEQMMNVNTTLKKLLDAQNSNASLAMINYIGREVTTKDGKINMSGGQISNTWFETSQDAPKATLKVYDSNGFLIKEQELGTLNKGPHQLAWDGMDKDGKKAPDGIYTFSISAKGMNEESLPVEVRSKAVITGVDINSKEQALFSNMGKLKYSDIVSIGAPGFEKSPFDRSAPPVGPGYAGGIPAPAQGALAGATAQMGTPSGNTVTGYGQPALGYYAQNMQPMGQPVQQMGQPVQQMGQPVQQMGQPAQQMGQPVQQMGQPAQQMG